MNKENLKQSAAVLLAMGAAFGVDPLEPVSVGRVPKKPHRCHDKKKRRRRQMVKESRRRNR